MAQNGVGSMPTSWVFCFGSVYLNSELIGLKVKCSVNFLDLVGLLTV